MFDDVVKAINPAAYDFASTPVLEIELLMETLLLLQMAMYAAASPFVELTFPMFPIDITVQLFAVKLAYETLPAIPELILRQLTAPINVVLNNEISEPLLTS
jgi:hypothetical protein